MKIATGLTQQTIALMRAQKNDVKIDVIMMDEVGAAQGNAEGLYEPLVSAKVPNIEKLYPQFRTKGDAYTKFMYVAQALVWHKDQVKTEAGLLDGTLGSSLQEQDRRSGHRDVTWVVLLADGL